MTRISSRYTVFYKRILPTICFAVLVVFVIGAMIGGKALADPMLVVVPLGIAVGGYFAFKYLAWDLVDEVFDHGDSLLVRNQGQEAIIGLSGIRRIRASTVLKPPRVTLELAVPSIFGSQITFTPVTRWSLNPVPLHDEFVRQLTARVDRARTGGTA